jgi:hypothetical protein
MGGGGCWGEVFWHLSFGLLMGTFQVLSKGNAARTCGQPMRKFFGLKKISILKNPKKNPKKPLPQTN